MIGITTQKGRVVYNRPHHPWTARDARRIILHSPIGFLKIPDWGWPTFYREVLKSALELTEPAWRVMDMFGGGFTGPEGVIVLEELAAGLAAPWPVLAFIKEDK